MMKLPQIPTPKNPEKGFTLIELMIVIAIIAILVAIALPAYQTYIQKAKFSEVINAATPAKTAITTYFQEQGNADAFKGAGYTTTTAFGNVASVTVTDGAAATLPTITVKALATGVGSGVNGKQVVLTPTAAGDSLTWKCTSDAADQYVPSFCT